MDEHVRRADRVVRRLHWVARSGHEVASSSQKGCAEVTQVAIVMVTDAPRRPRGYPDDPSADMKLRTLPEVESEFALIVVIN